MLYTGIVLKGKYHANCSHFKTQKCLSVSRNNKIIVKFVINYHPSAIKLSIRASGQGHGVGRYGLKIEKC